VAFTSGRNGGGVYQKASSGVGNDELLLSNGHINFPENWSPDGRFLLYVEGPSTANTKSSDLWILPLFGVRKPIPYLQTRFNEYRGKLSPDGRWVAYPSDESGRDEIYVAPFPEPSGKWLISTAGGMWPRWRRDGKELFYLAPDNTLMAVTVTAQGSKFSAGAAQPLFKSRPSLWRYPYDVSPDGQRFLVISPTDEGDSPPITLVVNWPALLKKR
jgi:Tol biopolymer transport system component